MSGITSIAVKLHINEITPSDLFLLIVPVFNTLLRSCDRTQNKFLNHTSNTIFSHFLGKKIKIKRHRLFLGRTMLDVREMLFQERKYLYFGSGETEY